jgi:chromatin segregation and condensation protein Rec8/ScpA/Scc1 (kleisin family)
MVDNKELLANNFISSIKNKISDITTNEANINDIVNYNMSNNENIYNIENTSLNISKLNNLNLEENNNNYKQKENKLNKPIKNEFDDIYTKSLFEEVTRPYVVVTFLSILEMSKNKEINITQDKTFGNITIEMV